MTDQLIAQMARLSDRLEQLECHSIGTKFANPVAMAHLCATLLRNRQKAFPDGYFLDASWEILLDLFIAKNTHKKLIVSDLGLTANIPATTVLRHLARLVDDGYVRRDYDPFDRRKFYVRITEHGSNMMIDVLQNSAESTLKFLNAAKTPAVMY